MNDQTKMSRRRFVELGAGLTFVLLLDGWGCKPKPKPSQNATVQPTGQQAEADQTAAGPWVHIHTDGRVTIFNPAAEMGQGSMTALPLILAEEMDADWSTVVIEDSPVDADVYGRSWGREPGTGTMMTVGSRAVMSYFTKLRLAGAQIRAALLQAAAAHWDVPVETLTTKPGAVVRSETEQLTYGELAALVEAPLELPNVTEADLKDPADFRLIGTSVPRADIPAKVDGSARFALDVELQDMLHAVIARSPVHGRAPKSHNAEEVRALSGVVTTVELDHGVGVLGESVDAVLTARAALKITWKEHPTEKFDSEKALAGYPKIATSPDANASTVNAVGDAARAMKAAAKRFEAGFFSDYACHAQMEPLNAVASVTDDGAEIWLGTQAPAVAKEAVADTLGINPHDVRVHRCYLGGGFGRRSAPDYVVEAVRLSAAVKKPVKLLWTRDDDLQYGMFRPMNYQRLEAGVDNTGKLTSWKHCIVGDGGRLLTSGIEIPLYDIPNQQLEMRAVSHGVRLHYWRAVGHPFNKWAIEAFIDEIARDRGVDPIGFRRLLVSDPRALRVLDAVERMSGWGETSPGRQKGVALAERSGAVAAGVAEISVDEASGELRVHRFWAAVDAGIIVQPDNAIAQMEGGIVMGLSSTLVERLTLKNGAVKQSNFHDYNILRMSQTPEIEVQLMESNDPPSGIGEPGVPITAGAVANAFLALTGKPLRHMPFTPERVKEALA